MRQADRWTDTWHRHICCASVASHGKKQFVYPLVADWSRQDEHQCQKCRNFRSGDACMDRCPKMKYSDNSSVCRPCHRHCHRATGCTGPDSGVGPDRCTACAFAKLAEDRTTVLECLNSEECEPGFYPHHHYHLLDRQTRKSASSRLIVIPVTVAYRSINVTPHYVITNALKPRPHQQQCRSNIRLCRKNRLTCSIQQCCFDIVAGVNDVSNLDETYKEYSSAAANDLIRFWRSKVEGQGHSRLSRWRSHLRRHCGVEVYLLVIF